MRSIVQNNRYFKLKNDFFMITDRYTDNFCYTPVKEEMRKRPNDCGPLPIFMTYEEFGRLLLLELLTIVDRKVHDKLELLFIQKELNNAR